MRYLNALALMAVAVFLFSTSSTEVFAKRPSNPAELEQRVTDLEGQVADHELRIQAEEQNTAGQNERLDSLEQEQETQNSRLDALESQPPVTGGIKVFDSSEPSQFVGILVGIYPTGYKASEIYREVEGSFTVYIPDLGKFIELNRTGEIITTRFRFEYVYYTDDGCNGTGESYAIPHPWDEVVDSAFISAHRFYIPEEGNTWTYYTVGGQVEVNLESSHDGSSCDNTPTGLVDAFTLTEVTLPFTLPLTPPLSFQ